MQSIAQNPIQQHTRVKRGTSTTNAPKYYLYALPTSHTCVGSKACIKCVKDNALDTSYAVSQSGVNYSPIVKFINVTMLDLDKCPPWLIGTPTLYETTTRIVYKGQNALVKLQGIARSDSRQYWIGESEAKTINGGRTGNAGHGGGISSISRPSALSSTSKGHRGLQSSRVMMTNVPRGAQGAQGMGGSNALRGAWNAQKRMSADALADSMSETARTQFSSGVLGTKDAKRNPYSKQSQRSFSAPTAGSGSIRGGSGSGEVFASMSTLRAAGDTSSTTAGNFALDPNQYDTAEARAAKIISQKADASAIRASSGVPSGGEAPTSPVDLATAFKKMQAARGTSETSN